MWSYPIIEDGLIYVVDIRNGLYVLEYHGPYEDEGRLDPVPGEQFQPRLERAWLTNLRLMS